MLKLGKVLVVDDQTTIHDSIALALRHENIEVVCASSISEGASLFKSHSEHFITAFVDHRLDQPDGSSELGVSLVSILKNLNKDIRPVMISGDEKTSVFKTWLDHDINRYLYKPLDSEHVKAYFQVDYERWLAKNESDIGKKTVSSFAAEKFRMVGRSSLMSEAIKIATKAAKSTSHLPVLIMGESGVGKELIAEGIHNLSSRSGMPLVTVNCAAFGESGNLLESELFGHEKGAFTGADKQKKGMLEEANKGTIFLDEVHTLSLSSQKKLLRFLQCRKIRRVGGNLEFPLDVRVIAAGKPDLPDLAKSKDFLPDLFYRLNGFDINIPSLRERRSDIPELADYFLRRENGPTGKKYLSNDTLNLIKRNDWVGNIRQLENAIIRAYHIADGDKIEPSDLPEHTRVVTEAVGIVPIPALKRDFESKVIVNLVKALIKSENNISLAARLLKIPRTDLHYKVKTYGLNKLKLHELKQIIDNGGLLCTN